MPTDFGPLPYTFFYLGVLGIIIYLLLKGFDNVVNSIKKEAVDEFIQESTRGLELKRESKWEPPFLLNPSVEMESKDQARRRIKQDVVRLVDRFGQLINEKGIWPIYSPHPNFWSAIVETDDSGIVSRIK